MADQLNNFSLETFGFSTKDAQCAAVSFIYSSSSYDSTSSCF